MCHILSTLTLYNVAPISLGRTRSRKTNREDGHLTYPSNAKLTIWAKHYNSQPDVWEAEVRVCDVILSYLLAIW